MQQSSIPIAPHETGSSHLIQLFDSEESIAEGVAQFLCDGIVRSEQTVVLISEERWYSVAMRGVCGTSSPGSIGSPCCVRIPSAGHFGDPRNAEDLCRTCAAHSGVRSNPEDVLGSFLVSRYHAA